MRIAVVQFPGSNCERETSLAIKRAGMEPIEFLWNEPQDKLREVDGYVIVGGFSYEDRSRAGIIAALDPVMQVIKQQSELGKPVLGICNGAQILVETGLVPGLENNKVGTVLAENKRVVNNKIVGTGYYNTWIHLRLSPNYQRNAFTRHLSSSAILNVPIAHGEGRFVMTDALYQEVELQGLNLFQYCDEQGTVIDAFPINPNGSRGNMAGLSNKAGNVLALMPHPERTLQGDVLFQSMRDYIAERQGDQHRNNEAVIPLYYYPRRQPLTAYQKPTDSFEMAIALTITDNQAVTVQHTLRQLGYPVTVKRRCHWQIRCASAAVYQQIQQSGVLFNDRKEYECEHLPATMDTATFLVIAKEDLVGWQKQQTLKDHFAINGIDAIRYGVLWQITAENGNIAALTDQILSTNMIHNPYAHDCYDYKYYLS